MKIGIIGLGLLGSALAERLLAAGFDVAGHDVDAAQAAGFAALGGRFVDDTGGLADCEAIVLSLPDGEVAANAMYELAPQLRRGTLIIDTTTADPQQTVALASRMQADGLRYLDCTIVGSSVQARAGEALALVGGSAGDFATAAPLLTALAKQAFHVGSSGAGAKLKLAVNLVLGLNRAALAEGLVLAAALGLDERRTLEVLMAGAAYSRVMDAKGPKMIDRDYAPQARLDQHLKDVRLMLAAAERAGLALPLTAAHRELLERASQAGFADSDNSALIEAYSRPVKDDA